MKLFWSIDPSEAPVLLAHVKDNGTTNEEATLLKRAALSQVLQRGGIAEVRQDNGQPVFRARAGSDIP